MEEVEFTDKVKKILKDRKCAYGSAAPQYHDIAKKWSVTLGINVTPEQVILCMIDLKSIRFLGEGSHKEDSAFDIAGYAALLSNYF